MKTKFTYAQQGDCLLFPAELPKGAKALKGAVLVEGAAGGNQHIAKGRSVKLYKANDLIYVKAGKFQMVHPEHKSIDVPAGTYVVKGVQEYDHFAEEARRVID